MPLARSTGNSKKSIGAPLALEDVAEEPKAEPIELIKEAVKFTMKYKEVADRKCTALALSTILT